MALRRICCLTRLTSPFYKQDPCGVSLNESFFVQQLAMFKLEQVYQTKRVYSTGLTQLCCSWSVELKNERPNMRPRMLNVEQRRFKKRRGPKKTDDDEEEEDEDEDLSAENPLLVDDILGEADDGSQGMDLNISSLRLDSVAKSAFGITRQRAEEAFYKGDLLINGERPSKKSQDLYEGDEIDLIRGVNEEDSMLVNIKRAVIVKLPDKASEHGRIKISLKVWQNMQIPNPGTQQKDED